MAVPSKRRPGAGRGEAAARARSTESVSSVICAPSALFSESEAEDTENANPASAAPALAAAAIRTAHLAGALGRAARRALAGAIATITRRAGAALAAAAVGTALLAAALGRAARDALARAVAGITRGAR